MERREYATRTGRHFFDDMQLEAELIDRVRKVLDKSGFWGDFNTDWVCLDCELMPWSAKAQKLLEEQWAFRAELYWMRLLSCLSRRL